MTTRATLIGLLAAFVLLLGAGTAEAQGASVTKAEIKTNSFGISDRVVLTFDQNLDTGSTPAGSAFQVISEYAGVRYHVSSNSAVTISGRTVTVGLSLAVRVSASFRVTYTKPSSNPLRTTGNVELDDFTYDRIRGFSGRRVVCNRDAGFWQVTNMGGFGWGDRFIPCDMAKPAWLFDRRPGRHGHIVWVYDGDYGSQPQGNLRPPVNQPVEAVTYMVPDARNHRAVLGTDGQCYREERVGGRWQRSVSYGSGTDACRKAAWNAYNRSQGRALVNPRNSVFTSAGTFPSGDPPTAPAFESAAVNVNTLTLTFDQNLDTGSVPSPGAFRVTVNNARRSVASGGVAISGKTVTLALTSSVTATGTVKVRYTRPSANPLRGANRIAVATFADQEVTNNTGGALVSNFAVGFDAANFGRILAGDAWAQAFTTGSTVGGYKLTDVQMGLVRPSAQAAVSYSVSIRSSSSGNPGASLGTLRKPASLPTVYESLRFRASGSGIDLAANTTYFVMVEVDAGSAVLDTVVSRTSPEDANPAPGWSLGDESHRRISGAWVPTDSPILLALYWGYSGPSGAAPAFESAAVGGTTLTMTFDRNLDTASVPAPGAFHVTVGSARRNVASGGVAISGKTVILTLASAVGEGDTVKVRYTRPSASPLQDASTGSAVATFADQAVTYTPPPAFDSAAVNLTTLTLTFDQNLDTGSVPSPGAFRVTVNNARRSVASGGVAISGKTVTLALTSSVTATGTVKVRYTRPSANPLRGANRIAVATFADQEVTNNTGGALVSNFAVGFDAANFGRILAGDAWAQAFTTGSTVGGYKLTDVQMGLVRPSAQAAVSYSVSIRSSSSGNPGASLGTLRKPASLPTVYESLRFRASGSGIDLAANTTYFVMVEVDAGSAVLDTVVSRTSPEDANPAPGWSLGDESHRRISGAWVPTDSPILLALYWGYSGPSGAAPAFESAAVGGTTLTMTFDRNLDTASVPAPGAFHVTVGSARRNVASGGVAISGKTVTLTLASPVSAGDTVKVRYTKPSANPLRGANRIAVATFADQTVTNSTPVGIWSATLTAKAITVGLIGCWNGSTSKCSTTSILTDDDFTSEGTTYQITRVALASTNSALAFSANSALSASSGWTLHVGDDEFAFADASISSDKLTATWTSTGLAWTADQEVSLRLTESLAPAFVSAAVNAKTLTVTFSKDLDTASVPAPGDFHVTVGSARRNVAAGGVAVSGKTVTLTLASTVAKNDTVKVRYTKPSTNPLKSTSDIAVATFADRAVTNNTPEGELWSATLTAKDFGNGVIGCSNASTLRSCSTSTILTDDDFTSGSTTYQITAVWVQPASSERLIFKASAALSSTWTLHVDDAEFAVSDATLTNSNKDAVWTNTGLTWTGEQEVSLSLTSGALPPTAPTFASAAVNGSTLTLTFDKDLDTASVPAPGDLHVTVGSARRNVAAGGVAISGKTVTLTLASSVAKNDTVKVRYTKPSASPLQDASTNLAVATFADQAVTNNTPEAELWSATLTVGDLTSGLLGCANALTSKCSTSSILTDDDFTSGSTSYRIILLALGDFGSGTSLRLGSSAALPTSSGWTLHVGNAEFAFSDATLSSDRRSATWSNPGLTWTAGQEVSLRLTSGAVAPTVPAFVSAAVNAKTLTVAFSKDLDTASVPAPGDFHVTVGSARRDVASGGVAISGKTVTLTLASSVVKNDTVKVRYTKPSANPLQDAGGLAVATFADQAVTNNTAVGELWSATLTVADLTSGTLGCGSTGSTGLCSSSSVLTDDSFTSGSTTYQIGIIRIRTSATLTTLELFVSSALSTNWTLHVDDREFVVSNAALSHGDTIASWGNPGFTWSAGETVSLRLTSGAVPPPGPAFASAAVNGSTLTLTFDQNLDTASVPAPGDFHVTVGSTRRNVGSGGVAISGKTVTLTLASTVVKNDTVKVRYTKPSTNPLQGASGLAVATFTDQAVTNNTPLLWLGTLTVKGLSSTIFGCSNADATASNKCSTSSTLTDDDFTSGSTSYQFINISHSTVHNVTFLNISVSAALSSNWTLHVGSRQLAVSSATLSNSDKTALWTNPGFTWTAGQTVSLRLTEAAGGAGGAGGNSGGVEPASVSGVSVVSSAGADKTYGGGDKINVRVTFSEAVDVTGTPRLKIDMDPAEWGEKWAAYESGSGTSSLTFAHTVVEPNISTQGIAVLANTLELNGGTIRAGGADASLAHDGLAHDANHKVDWRTAGEESGGGGTIGNGGPPSVTGVAVVSSPASGDTYLPGETIRIRATFSEAVTVTGSPGLSIDMDPAHWGTKQAAYASGSGTTGLTFAHAVVEPNLSRQGIAVLANTLALSGGTIRSAGGTDAALGHTGLAHDSRHKVDWRPTISVADAQANEGAGATVAFEVSLSRAFTSTEHRVTVDYATADGTATAGEDYTATSGTLTFSPGEKTKTVSVSILDDAVDEGNETFTLTLSNVRGAREGDLEATGTIANDDPLQEMWLSRFGRTVAGHVTDAVSDRLANPLAGAQVTVGGQSVDLAQTEDGAALTQALTGLARALGASEQPASGDGFGSRMGVLDGPGSSGSLSSGTGGRPGTAAGVQDAPALDGAPSRDLSGRELLLGSAFHLAAEGDGTGPGLAAWGRVTVGGFDGEERADGGTVRIDGEVTSGILGADAEWNRLLAGVAVSVSEGEGTFAQTGVDSGTIESSVTMVSPYARVTVNDRVSVWGLAGWGTGDMTIVQAANDRGQPERVTRTDIEMRLGAIGGRGALLQADETGGIDVGLRADAFYVETESDPVSNEGSTTGVASRVRLALEGSRSFETGGGGVLTPGVEVGLRHDGGDAETGTGVELGGRVSYKDPETGLSVEARVRTLVAHEDSDYREWGASGAVRLDPGERGRGLSFSLAPTWGAAGSGMGRLWSARDARGIAPGHEFEAAQRLDGELGYGLGLFGDRFTGTPNLGFGLSDNARDWRIGWRLTSVVRGDPGFEVNLDATRREAVNDNEPAEHEVMLRGAIRW